MGQGSLGRAVTRIVRYYPRALVGDGGMTGAVRRWSESLSECGADVTVAYDRGPPPPPVNGVRWAPVRHRGLGDYRVPVDLADIVRDADLLVLHSGWTLHNIRAARTARKLGVPYLLEPRGAYDPHIVHRHRAAKRMWWMALERRLVMGARAIHVFFDDERAHLEAIGYRGLVISAPNGVDAPTGPRWDGGSGGYVLWLGRFDPGHKGLDILLDALGRLPPAERPTLRLHGPDWRGRKESVRSTASRLGVEPWAEVRDAVYGDLKRRVLVQATGFVYPSRWDACPNSVLEAVSLGIPTLTTSYPLGRMLAARGGALACEPSPGDVAGGLRRLLSAQAAEVGARGAEVARDALSWSGVARRWLDQVEALL
jgi:glycosyltransferase involved in cell wall biosynthesis